MDLMGWMLPRPLTLVFLSLWIITTTKTGFWQCQVRSSHVATSRAGLGARGPWHWSLWKAFGEAGDLPCLRPIDLPWQSLHSIVGGGDGVRAARTGACKHTSQSAHRMHVAMGTLGLSLSFCISCWFHRSVLDPAPLADASEMRLTSVLDIIALRLGALS